jgi:hypothetical protein
MLALAASLIEVACTSAQQQKPLNPLPAEIVAAWEKAGAKVGWLGPNEYGYPVFRFGEEGRKEKCPPSRSLRGNRGYLAGCLGLIAASDFP